MVLDIIGDLKEVKESCFHRKTTIEFQNIIHAYILKKIYNINSMTKC